MRLKRRRDHNRCARFPFKTPKLFAGKVVRTRAITASQNKLFSAVMFPYVRCRPVAWFLAFDLPNFLAGHLVVNCQPTVLLVVIDDNQIITIKNRGRSGAPSVAHLVRLEHLLPKHLAGFVEAVESMAAEIGVNPLAIRHRCLRRITVLDVNRRQRPSRKYFLLPKIVAGFQLKAQNHKVVHMFDRLLAVATIIEPWFTRLYFTVTHR